MKHKQYVPFEKCSINNVIIIYTTVSVFLVWTCWHCSINESVGLNKKCSSVMKSEISCLVWRLPAEFCRQVIYCIQTCLFRSSNLVLRFREETSNLMNAQQLNTSITLLCLLLTTFNNSIYKPAPNKLGTIFKTNTNHHSESTNFNLLHLHQPYSSQFFIDY